MRIDRQETAEKAYADLFPDSIGSYTFTTYYNNRIKPFGGYVAMRGSHIEFRLSKKWVPISQEIRMGLMQELLLKLLKRKKQTMYIDLYNNFIRSLHLAIPKDKNDPQLEASFNRVNDKYFVGLVERPNLQWGQLSTRTFGSYDFKTDTVTMSTVFKNTEGKYLDYVMFHELLHKQRKFFKSGSKTYYHDAKFKRLEAVFEDGEQIEKELGHVAAKEKLKAYFRPKEQRAVKKKSFFDWF
jgi:predicted SprT family Zn-dependent metalloprotease